MTPDGEQQGPDRPEYRVYKSRKGPFSRFRKSDLDGLREKTKPRSKRSDGGRGGRGGGGYDPGRAAYEAERAPRFGERPRKERKPFFRRGWVKWLLFAVIGWILLSFIAFAVSAQLQSMKLDGAAKDALSGSPWLLAKSQNILIIGTDGRDPTSQEPGAAEEKRCYEQQAQGEAPHDGCPGARADTLLLLRAGGGKFKKLSIPRDSFAEIPGHDAQKINAAYAFGGAALQIQTVKQFLGIPIDHVVIMNFTGFSDFINAIGGVKVDVPEALCGQISGGKKNGGTTIRLKKGSNTLDGTDALAYARTREDTVQDPKCQLPAGYDDLDRAAAQQRVLNGIKGRLTSPLRLPYNFIKGPIIGWTAPKAFVSDMGMLAMPQLALSSIFAGSSPPDVLVPSGAGPGGSLEISDAEKQRAVNKLEN